MNDKFVRAQQRWFTLRAYSLFSPIMTTRSLPFSFPDAEQIAAMPTRQLLARLDSARAIASAADTNPNDQPAFSELQTLLKTELATREHVPGTLESKQARQERQARPEKKAMRY
jgi:hypothetical protein